MTKPLYIFDLDGTLADISHRRHLVEAPAKRWRDFYAACTGDVPNEPVVRTAQGLTIAGAEVWVWSGRSDEVQLETEEWLRRHVCTHSLLRMRQAKDHQPDVKLKRSWLQSMDPVDRARLVAVFDDRDGVVRMWRAEGVACFQVAPGNF
jgi:FMN phosphatase YigB (HAD superfamily)